MIPNIDPMQIVQIMPANGWRIHWTHDDGSTSDGPLIGWALLANGNVIPLDADNTGYVADPRECVTTQRIYHPGARYEEDGRAGR